MPTASATASEQIARLVRQGLGRCRYRWARAGQVNTQTGNGESRTMQSPARSCMVEDEGTIALDLRTRLIWRAIRSGALWPRDRRRWLTRIASGRISCGWTSAQPAWGPVPVPLHDLAGHHLNELAGSYPSASQGRCRGACPAAHTWPSIRSYLAYLSSGTWSK
jgi:hypothetical protein